MRLNYVESVGGQLLRFVISENFERHRVAYNRVTNSVVCASCASTSCIHINWMVRFLEENESWQVNDFIQDCCSVSMDFQQIQTMKNDFRAACSYTGNQSRNRPNYTLLYVSELPNAPGLRFQIKDENKKEYFQTIDYLFWAERVVCGGCEKPCKHINFLHQFFYQKTDEELSEILERKVGYLYDRAFIKQLRKVFALEASDTPTPPKSPPPPSPFSLVELD